MASGCSRFGRARCGGCLPAAPASPTGGTPGCCRDGGVRRGTALGHRRCPSCRELPVKCRGAEPSADDVAGEEQRGTWERKDRGHCDVLWPRSSPRRSHQHGQHRAVGSQSPPSHGHHHTTGFQHPPMAIGMPRNRGHHRAMVTATPWGCCQCHIVAWGHQNTMVTSMPWPPPCHDCCCPASTHRWR